MAVKDPATIERYASHHADMIAMLENLREFVSTMPAPDENCELTGYGVDYGYTGDVARIHAKLKEASGIAYKITQ